MKVDNYTRFLLTAICFCLVYLCLKDLLIIPTVHADAPVRVVLVDGNNRPVTGGGGTMGLPLVVQVER
jgi:hypothetical protein